MTHRSPTVRGLRGGPEAARTDLLIVPVSEGDLRASLARLTPAVAGRIRRRAREAAFVGRPEEVLAHHGEAGSLLLIGMGAAGSGSDAWRRLGARGRREAERQGARRVGAYLGAAGGRPEVVAAVAEGFQLAGYRFDRYKREPGNTKVGTLLLMSEEMAAPRQVGTTLRHVDDVVGRVFAARDVINEPPSIATPRYLAEHARRLASSARRLEVEIWTPARIARERMAGLLAVARGSHEEPRFIILRFAPPDPRRRVALVGKGISFDSGGLSLKPAKSMETMKYDLAGGATVLSAVACAAALELPLAVTAYVPVTENMPGGRAQKPGDVIRFANDKTVEVLNTDAEGRLVLADALLRASRDRPDAIIDLATLTGAARVALGGAYAAVLGTDQALVDALVTAGVATGELLWQLPLHREYRDDLKSSVADLRNVGSGDAGTILAALFLSEFVDGVPWAHIDIAATAFSDKEGPLGPRGATGFGVRLLVEHLRRLAA